MKILLRKATISDVHNIMPHLSYVNRAELFVDGSTAWDMIGIARGFLKNGTADAVFLGDELIAIFGHCPNESERGVRTTWFLATERFWELGVRGVVYARKYLSRLRREYPTTPFVSYSDSPHPAVNRWFSLLGYRQLYAPYLRCKAFRLEPPSQDALRDEARRT
jgi:hypothetical protein